MVYHLLICVDALWHNICNIIGVPSVNQWVKDPTLSLQLLGSLLRCRIDLWPGTVD